MGVPSQTAETLQILADKVVSNDLSLRNYVEKGTIYGTTLYLNVSIQFICVYYYSFSLRLYISSINRL